MSGTICFLCTSEPKTKSGRVSSMSGRQFREAWSSLRMLLHSKAAASLDDVQRFGLEKNRSESITKICLVLKAFRYLVSFSVDKEEDLVGCGGESYRY